MQNEAKIVDCDIHPYVSEQCPIEPFVPDSLRLAVEQGLANRPTHGYSNPFGLIRRDAHCQSARQLVDEHLDKLDIEFCILQPPGVGVGQINNIDVANGMAEAWNDWQIENYLKRDQRILGSICVNMADPSAAVREIRRMAKSCPRMVQVIVPGESRELYGHRQYYPVYEACEELGLPLGLHPGQEGSLGSATPVGRPSNYFEWHTIIPLTFQAHTVSMICEGVFERFPRLRVVLVEGGISWLPPLLWRLDKNYKALRSTVPWLKELPSEYALRHVRLTTQPIEEPPQKGQLAQMFRMVQADRTVLFSSDYPHWDYDDPVRCLPADLGDDTIRRIMYDNAFAFFRLERFSEEVARPTV